METTVTGSQLTTTAQAGSGVFAGRQGRRRKEALLAYLFLLPAFLIVGLFGIFPLIFATYQSTLRGLNKIDGTFDGLFNYVKAIDDLAYVLGFWLAALLVYLSIRTLRRAPPRSAGGRASVLDLGPARHCHRRKHRPLHLIHLPAASPPARSARADARTGIKPGPFSQACLRSLSAATGSGRTVGRHPCTVLGIGLQIYISRRLSTSDVIHGYMGQFISATPWCIGAAALVWLTWTDINKAYATLWRTAKDSISGPRSSPSAPDSCLLLVAWWLWESASYRNSNASMAMRLGGAAMLLVGAWFLIGELPAHHRSRRRDLVVRPAGHVLLFARHHPPAAWASRSSWPPCSSRTCGARPGSASSISCPTSRPLSARPPSFASSFPAAHPRPSTRS